MADNLAPQPNMRDLMAAVAYVLLHWGWLEAEIRERIEAIEPDRQLFKGSLWGHWRSVEPEACQGVQGDIQTLADIRNCLAHGLCGARADPHTAGEPHVVCQTSAGHRLFTMSELERAADALHVARNNVRDGSFERLGGETGGKERPN
jgi:hypothetical protein